MSIIHPIIRPDSVPAEPKTIYFAATYCGVKWGPEVARSEDHVAVRLGTRLEVWDLDKCFEDKPAAFRALARLHLDASQASSEAAREALESAAAEPERT